MKYNILLILIFPIHLFSDVTTETIHASISTYYENKTYDNSAQKTDGNTYGFGADIHANNSEYKFIHEHAHTNTKQPPLPKDLKVDKIFLRYGYKFTANTLFNINYINVVDDNLAQTDGGKVFGLGFTYKPTLKSLINLTQYYSEYDNFNIYQSDLNLAYKIKINKITMKIKSITKYINIDEKNKTSYTKYTKDDYLTTGILLHAHYKLYHVGIASYFGKRIFAVMSDGFKLQHHAVEINKTNVISIGKSVNNFIFRVQYIYQEGSELPVHRDNVKINNTRIVVNYRF